MSLRKPWLHRIHKSVDSFLGTRLSRNARLLIIDDKFISRIPDVGRMTVANANSSHNVSAEEKTRSMRCEDLGGYCKSNLKLMVSSFFGGQKFSFNLAC